jgi:hypothetical protein
MTNLSPGMRYGAFALVSVDATRKRATCVCICGVVQAVAVDALESGQLGGCGCRMTPRSAQSPAPMSAFATDLAELERRARSRRPTSQAARKG